MSGSIDVSGIVFYIDKLIIVEAVIEAVSLIM